MSFAGVIVFELGYDGETIRQHEFVGAEAVFDKVVAAPAELARLREALDQIAIVAFHMEYQPILDIARNALKETT